MARDDAVLRVRLDTGQSNAELEKLRRALKKAGVSGEVFEQKMDEADAGQKRFATGLGGLKTAIGALGLGLLAQRAARATAALVEIGASAAETRSKFETTLGPSVEAADSFLDSFATTAGLARTEAENLFATTSAVAQGFGFLQQESANVAQEIVELAGDIASFNNSSTAEEIQRITSALAGERESLKQRGIVITQAEVDQRALTDTLKETASALTQQEKALATLALITEKAGPAVGDLARTSESLANQQKQARAEVSNLISDLGELAAGGLETSGAVGDMRDEFQRFGELIVEYGPEIEQMFRTTFEVGSKTIGIAATTLRGFTEIWLEFQRADQRNQAWWEDNFGTRAQRAIADTKESSEEVLRLFSESLDTRDDARVAAEAAAEAERQAKEAAEAHAAALEAQKKAYKELLDSASDIRDATEFGLAAESDLLDVREQLQKVAENEERSLSDRLAAHKEILRIDERRAVLAEERAAAAARSQPDVRDMSGFDVGGGTLVGGVDVGGVNETLARLTARLRELRGEGDDTDASASALIGTFGGLADNMGVLDGRARDAVRAIGDVADGLDQGGILGAVGVIGGVIGGLDALFNDTRAEQVEAARDAFEDALDDYVAELTDPDRWERLRSSASEEFSRLVDDLFEASAPADASGDVFLESWRGVLDAFEDGQLTLDQFRSFLLDTFGDDAQQLLDAYGEKLSQIEETRREEIASFEQSLELQLLRAQGDEEAVQALRDQIALEKLLAEARDLGISEEYVRTKWEEIQAAEDAAKAQREAAAAAEEARRKEEELAEERRRQVERRDDFHDSLSFREDALTASDDELRIMRLRERFAEEVEEARELVDEGVLSIFDVEMLKEIQDAELAGVMREIAEAAEEAAEAERERAEAIRDAQRAAEEDLDVQLLRLQGEEKQAALLELQLERERRIAAALEEGQSDSFITKLRELFNLREGDILDRFSQSPSAQRDLAAVRGAADGDDTVLVRSFASITSGQASDIVALTRSQNSILRSIERNTRGQPRNGGSTTNIYGTVQAQVSGGDGGASADAALGSALRQRQLFLGQVRA